MNAQELFLDVSSGRFLDGQTTIPKNKPVFYANEERSTLIKIYKVEKNQIISVEPSANCSFKSRIGTATNKLTDGFDPTAPTQSIINATGIIVTKPSIAASAVGNIKILNSVTATITCGIGSFSAISQTPEFVAVVKTATTMQTTVSAIIESATVVTAAATCSIFTASFVTPVITCSIVTIPASQIIKNGSTRIKSQLGGIDAPPALACGLDLTIEPYTITTFSSRLSIPVGASFSATITNGSVSTISIIEKGSGYQDGSYQLTFSGSSTVTAQAIATVVSARVRSISIVESGSGYSSAPLVSITAPQKAVRSIDVSTFYGTIENKQAFIYPTPAVTSQRLEFSFTPPPYNSLENTSVPSAFATFYSAQLRYEDIITPTGSYISRYDDSNGIWLINFVSGGYGYVTAPSVTIEDVTINAYDVNRVVERATTSGLITTIDGNAPLISSVSPTVKDVALSMRINETRIAKTIPLSNTGLRFRIRPQNSFVGTTDIGSNAKNIQNFIFEDAIQTSTEVSLVSPVDSIQWLGPNKYVSEFGFGQLVLNEKFYPLALGATPTREYNIGSYAYIEENAIGNYGQYRESPPTQTNIGKITKEPLPNLRHDLYSARTIYYAIKPTSGSPTRFALIAVTLPSESLSYNVSDIPSYTAGDKFYEYLGFTLLPQGNLPPSYFVDIGNKVAQLAGTIDRNRPDFGVIDFGSSATKQPGGGTVEPYIQIIDYGEGYTNEMITSGVSLVQLDSAITGEVLATTNELLNYEPTNSSPFIPTLYSRTFSVTSQPIFGEKINYLISDGGLGYEFGKAPAFKVTKTTITGSTINIRLLNQPEGYPDGIYNLEITSAPSGGTDASASLLVSGGQALIDIGNYGTGYVTAPAITVPTINIKTGYVNFAKLTNVPNLYSDRKHYFEVEESPTSGGTAAIYLANNNCVVENPGFGYSVAPVLTAPPPDLASVCVGYIKDIRVITMGTGYQPGTYSLQIKESPVTGGTGSAVMVVGTEITSVRIINPGYGYSTAPSVTAISPNISSSCFGYVEVYARRAGSGYSDGLYSLTFTPPPSGGELPVAFYDGKPSSSGTIVLQNAGKGYVTAPEVKIIQLPNYEQSEKESGYVENVSITNKPLGYDDGIFAVTVASSPVSNGTALVQLQITNGLATFEIIDRGFGYATPPSMIASAPNEKSGKVQSLSVVSFGLGYEPNKVYTCFVPAAPTQGRTAKVDFVTDSNTNGQFIIQDFGYGYTSNISISVATPAGSVVSGITITCGGTYYTLETATYNISDSSGRGLVLGNVIVNGGAVSSLQVIDGGHNFGDKPQIIFNPPARPAVLTLPANMLATKFNISSASANVILGTSTNKDIILEIYETDGTEEQVVAQATVSLAKRVLE